MILVVGGIASGKRTYVQSRGCNEDRVWFGLERTLRDGPLSQDAFDELITYEAVVCCEVGLGVVPIDKDERAWRELVGRTCCQLAGHADEVIRMVCGIPVRMK